jgi:DNA adenine methylase
MQRLTINVEKILPPFLKWAGSKRHPYIVDKVAPIWEQNKDRLWVEPFLGSGGLPLALGVSQGIFADINPHLIDLWKWVQTEGLVTEKFTNTELAYVATRREFNRLVGLGLLADKVDDLQPLSTKWKGIKSQLFYYLNQTGFNGLCRFNSRGEFNVPYGRDKDGNPKKINYVTNFSVWRNVISDWTIKCADFREVIKSAPVNSCIYSDSPYQGTFTGYYGSFTNQDQFELAALLAQHKGVVIASNSPEMEPLYKELGFNTELITASRSISCKGNSRGKQLELFATKGI